MNEVELNNNQKETETLNVQNNPETGGAYIPKKKKSYKGLIITLVAIIVVVFAVVGIFFVAPIVKQNQVMEDVSTVFGAFDGDENSELYLKVYSDGYEMELQTFSNGDSYTKYALTGEYELEIEEICKDGTSYTSSSYTNGFEGESGECTENDALNLLKDNGISTFTSLEVFVSDFLTFEDKDKYTLVTVDRSKLNDISEDSITEYSMKVYGDDHIELDITYDDTGSEQAVNMILKTGVVIELPEVE